MSGYSYKYVYENLPEMAYSDLKEFSEILIDKLIDAGCEAIAYPIMAEALLGAAAECVKRPSEEGPASE